MAFMERLGLGHPTLSCAAVNGGGGGGAGGGDVGGAWRVDGRNGRTRGGQRVNRRIKRMRIIIIIIVLFNDNSNDRWRCWNRYRYGLRKRELSLGGSG